MLGVRSTNSLAFYEWDNLTLIRRIEIQPRGVYWSENGELVCISTEDSYFVLRYDADAVAKSLETKEGLTDDAGIEVILFKEKVLVHFTFKYIFSEFLDGVRNVI
jgi:coatomer subunit beta'